MSAPSNSTIYWSCQKLEPCRNAHMARTVPVKLAASLNLAKGTVLGEKVGTNSKQTLTISGGPTGGTFTLTLSGQTTAAIAYNAEADVVQAAIEALSNVGSGNVRVTEGPFPGEPMTVEFIGAKGGQVVATMTHTDSLTGGSSPAVAVASIQAGAAGSAGTYAPYAYTNTDGTQTPKVILAYDAVTDASGNITQSSDSGRTSGDEFGVTENTVMAYEAGEFLTSQLVGFDTHALDLMRARLVQGTINSGVVRLP